MKRIAWISIALCFLSTQAIARIWNITPDGNGDAPTIQAGIDSTAQADTVLVAPGTYPEVINFGGKDITVGSFFLTTQDTSYISLTVIDADGINRSVAKFQNGESNLALLSGLTLMNGSGTNAYFDYGGGIYCQNASPTLIHLIVKNNSAHDYGGGIACCYESSPIIEYVTIENNHTYGLGGGIFCELADSVVIRNSIIRGNIAIGGGTGISAYGNDVSIVIENTLLYDNIGNTCILNEGGDNSFDLINVTLVNSQSYAIKLNYGGKATIVNSVLWGNGSSQIVASSSPVIPNSVVVAFSDIAGGLEGIQGNLDGSVAWLDGNINLDPLFINAGAGDYQLSPGSPCIDTGTPFFEWEGVTFVDLSPDQYVGPAPDMGAFEFYSVSSTETDDSLPSKFLLQQNYPNPFNPRTTITYNLEKEKTVNLNIFDLAGRLVAMLVAGENQSAGRYTATWMGRDLHGRAMPSGTYFYRLNAGQYTETKRMLLVR